MGSMSETATPRTATRHPDGLSWKDLGLGERIITGLLITLWLMNILLTLWSAPQRASVADAEAAITGNRIISTERSTNPPADLLTRLLGTSFQVGADETSDQGEYLQWTDRQHRHHWIPLDEVRQVAARHANPDVKYGTDSSDTAAAGQELTFLQFSEHAHSSHVSWEYLPALALGLMEFGLVIAGTARRGTRWFWFWLLLVPSLPLDAGLPLYIWSEVLHRGRWGRRRRVCGWYGLGLCFLAHVVAQMAIVTMGGICQLISGR